MARPHPFSPRDLGPRGFGLITMILFSLCSVLSLGSTVQAQTTWERKFGGDYNEQAKDIIQPARDLAFVIVGETDSYGPGAPGNDNPYIMKVDYAGNLLWFRAHGTEAADGACCVRETLTRDGYVMCGYRRLTPDHEVMLVIRTDALGNLIWERTYGGDYSGFATSVTPTLDGGFLLTGYLTEAYPAYASACLIKLNMVGNVVWKRIVSWPFESLAYRVVPTVDGGFVFAGTANVGGELRQQYFVIWTNATGLPYRVRTYGGVGADRLVSIEHSTTGYTLVGNVTDDPPVNAWPHIIAITRNGDVRWDRVLTESFTQPVYGCRGTPDGGLILAGGMNQYPQMSDLYIMKTDSQGEMSWRTRYGTGSGYTDVGYAGMQTRDGGYIVAGFSSFGGPGDSIYVIKTLSDGTLGTTISLDIRPERPAPGLSVGPNPFRSITSIPGHDREPVVLYDVGGRIVGRYEGARIGADLSPGVYFLKLYGMEGDPIRIVKTP